MSWVTGQGVTLPGFAGAFLAGSTNDLPDEAALDASTDLDVMVVLEGGDASHKPGKFRYRDVLLEISFIGADALSDPDTVLGHYHLGRAIATARILADPTGRLHRLKDDVGRRFADREWVEARTRQAAETVLARLGSITPERPLAEQVMAWLFAAGGLPHVLLVAGLRNPTVRKRYVAARDLLEETGDEGRLYEAMLDLLDPGRMCADRVRQHLDVLAGAFDAASEVVRSPVFFASDLLPEARPLSIDGSRELVDAGLRREAIFWIVATFCRCQIVLHADAPPGIAHRWDDAFRELLADLGIRSHEDLRRRGEEIRVFLPVVSGVANELVQNR